MPTTFLGLFLFSTALSLVATFTALAVQAVIRKVRSSIDDSARLPRQ